MNISIRVPVRLIKMLSPKTYESFSNRVKFNGRARKSWGPSWFRATLEATDDRYDPDNQQERLT